MTGWLAFFLLTLGAAVGAWLVFRQKWMFIGMFLLVLLGALLGCLAGFFIAAFVVIGFWKMMNPESPTNVAWEAASPIACFLGAPLGMAIGIMLGILSGRKLSKRDKP